MPTLLRKLLQVHTPAPVAAALRAKGADFSSNQSLTTTAKAMQTHGGLDFAFVKVSQGLGYVNPLLRSQAGEVTIGHQTVAVGLYHFLTDEDGARQWDHFEQAAMEFLHSGTPHLIAADYESMGLPVNRAGDATCRAFIKRGQQRGFKVGLYGSADVAARNLGQDWTWAAWWKATPPPFRWDFWQFADRPLCDWDVFRGDRTMLAAFLVRNGRRSVLTPPAQWWLHDETNKQTLGPYSSAAVAAARFITYVLSHGRSRLFTIRRA